MATIGSILIDGQDPDMPGLRRFLANLDGRVSGALAQLLAAFVAGEAVVVYAVRSSLYGNLAPADRSLGIVYNDGDNNGLYIKAGATGSGSWNATGLMLRGEQGEDGPQGKAGAVGKSFLQAAIDTGYVPAGTTEAQFVNKVVGQITANAVAARDAAKSSEVVAGQKAAASEASANLSFASAATSDAAKQAVLDNIAGINVSVGLQLQAVSVAALQAITDRPVGRQAYLSENGRAGSFIWSTANLSAVCALDTATGIYVPPAGQNGSAGAWVRVINPGQRWYASWFGLPTGADDSAIIRSIEALRPVGSDVKFSAGTFKLSNIKIYKPGHWSGSGKLTVMQHSGTSDFDTFGICTKGGTRFSHMRFTGLITPDNANARFPLYVCARGYETDYPQDSEDHEFDNLWFDGCSTGIRVSYGNGMVNGQPVFFTPNRTSIHHCVFACTYQDVIPESRDIHIYKNVFLRPDTADNSRPLAYCLRVLGCSRVLIEDNYISAPSSFAWMTISAAGVDDGTLTPGGATARVAYRVANDVTFRGNRIMGGKGIVVSGCSGVIRLSENKHRRDPTLTDRQPWLIIQGDFPAFFGSIIAERNHVVGFVRSLNVVDCSTHHIRMEGNVFIGNAYEGGVFDEAAVNIQIQGNDQGGNLKTGPKLLEVLNEVYALSPSAAIPIVFLGGTADQWTQTRIHIRNCVFPYASQAGFPMLQRGGGAGDPWVNFGTGAPKRFSAIDLTTITSSIGGNTRFDADAWEQMRMNDGRPETTFGPFPANWA